ncbi:MAG TPA: MOSC N-terminal beta barrel domain-containing protein [Candidatus Binatus sp.]|nr:MOSC N-terminal beta barrel domain-containing protein [Candidatus Binatus sp.]
MIRVARLSIAPVRSLGLLHPEALDLTETGVAEDRRFYLIDDDDRLVDRITAGTLVQVGAWADPDGARLRLTLPDGTSIEDEVELGEAIQTVVHKRIAVGHLVIGPWAAAIAPFAGRRVRLVRCDRPGGTRFKEGRVRNAISLVSDGSLRRLAAAAGSQAIDGRRFRMLIEVDGAMAHEEDGWIGGRIGIGSAELAITKADARCAITTQHPDTGRRDLDVLRTIIGYRGVTPDRKVLFGVLGEVRVPGRVALGDEVRLLELAAAASQPTLAQLSSSL